jgi:uncharacterized membrane protein YdbT with pleckstrin-like domain
MWYLHAGAFLVVLVVTVILFAVGDDSWYRVFLTVWLALFPVGWLQLRARRVTLGPESLTIVDGLFRRRTVPRDRIESVTWGAGMVSVKLLDGSWVHLPEVGGGAQSLTNSVRAWIKRTAAAAE